MSEVARPLAVEGREVMMSASVGSCAAGHGNSADELLRNADVAMYEAKEAGRGQHRAFEPSMYNKVARRMGLESELRAALAEGQFALHYQPIVRLAEDRIAGVEALVRWSHPERGVVPPAVFIEVAESTGLIVPLGRWVLEEACRQTREWQQRRGQSLSVSVNVSPHQLRHSSFTDDVWHAMEASGLDPACVVLEVTEGVLMNSSAIERLAEISRLGVGVALDDFGTGYSSLSYLDRLPIDHLKIDKAFIDGIHDEGRATLPQAVIKLGQALGLTVVAEGVELPEQARVLESLQCELVQGYLFAKPCAPEQLQGLLFAGVVDTSWRGRLAGIDQEASV